MLAHFSFLFATLAALSCAAQAEDDINAMDGSIIARLKMGPGFYTRGNLAASPAVSVDAGYRSFDGFGVVATGTFFLSASTVAESSSASFFGAVPSYTFDHVDLSLGFGIGVGYMHYTHTDTHGDNRDQGRLGIAPIVQGDYQLTRDFFVNLALSLFLQAGDGGAFILDPSLGVGWRF